MRPTAWVGTRTIGITSMTGNGRTFLITGVSSGLGRAFAEGALAAGHTIVGTVRQPEAAVAFESFAPGRAHGLVLDVTDFAAIPEAVAKVEREVGAIHVLVNNAGYGQRRAGRNRRLPRCATSSDVNVFGAVAMIKAVLPGMRERRSGHIVNVTSMGGFITMPGIAYYCGSKFALEGSRRLWRRRSGTWG